MQLISVIMPVYNIKSFKLLNSSIKSILNQTYKNFEFIICDDGSTDRTLEYIYKIKKKNRRIKVIRNSRNYGLSYSLNKCISMSKGSYIARMDADDIALSNRLEIQYKFLKKNQHLDFVGTFAYLIDSSKKKLKIRKVPKLPVKKDFLIGTPFIHPTLMIKKKVYKKLKGYNLNNNVELVEDYEFFMRAHYFNFKGANLSVPLIKYRINKKKRDYKFRINEAKIQHKWFSLLGLFPLGYLYIIKTLLVDIVPRKLKIILKKKYESFN